MFRVAFLVDDKKLAQVLHDITGVALNLEVAPAVNGATEPSSSEKTPKPLYKRGKYRGRNKKVSAATNGTQVERLLTHLKGEFKAGATITTTDVRSVLRAEHIKATNCGPLIYELRKRGYLFVGDGSGNYVTTEKMNEA
jgi:hypothetical protein